MVADMEAIGINILSISKLATNGRDWERPRKFSLTVAAFRWTWECRYSNMIGAIS